MEMFRMTEEEWKRLEPLLVEAEKQGREEYFQSGPGDPARPEDPGTFLLRHLIRRGDAEGVVLFRAVEMYFHELSRKGYMAAFTLGKQSSGGEREAEAR